MKRLWGICAGLLVGIAIGSVPSADAAYPGGNGLIAFVRGDSVYSMYADGTHIRRLTVPEQPTFRLSSPEYPSWSADGNKIAFVALRAPFGGESETDVFVMKANGSDLHSVAEGARGGVSWSPDASEIAYTDHYHVGGTERRYVQVVHADGTAGTTIAGAESFDPSWSPDGRTIVFRSETPALEAANPDGTGRRVLVFFSAARPDWSPDGSRLLFDDGETESGRIYMANADGSGMREIASGGYAPAWSPDGAKILYTTADGLIKYLRPDGTAGDLGRAKVVGKMPDWQPCGSGVRCPDTTSCVVPRVAGLSVKRARMAIIRAGCSVGKIRRPRSVNAAQAIVARQSPRPGTRLGHGAKVNLVLVRKR